MEGVWQSVQEIASGFYAGAVDVVKAAEPWQILVVAGALILMVLFLAIGLRVANRSGENAASALEESARQLKDAQDVASKAEEKVSKAEEKVSQAEEKVIKAQAEKQEALQSFESAKSLQLAESVNQLTLAKARIEQLERLQSEETVFISSARMEAARIVRDAKDYAFTVASRTDVEYAEMMRHANEEAENLRALSQQRLDQAHETLKKALNRATEIVAEAHAEAGRFSRPWYEAPPARLIDAEAGAFGGAEPAPEEPAAPHAADAQPPVTDAAQQEPAGGA
jgi:chromosome segregation ATPase